MLVTVLDGIAKPMPAAAPPSCGLVAASVGMPITCPSRFTSAPPLLPGLIAALVWMALISTAECTPSPGEPGGLRCEGAVPDGPVILFVIVVNTTAGIIQEVKADHAISALTKLTTPDARIIRADA